MPRKISDITESDRKISIVGKIIEISTEKSSFILDDNTGKIEAFIGNDSPVSIEQIKSEKGKLVRAFCMVVGEQLMLDVLQLLSGTDLNLLKTVDDLYSKAGI